MQRILLFLAAILFATGAFAGETEKQKIDYLLEKIGSSDIIFIRNGTEHSGKEASDHLRSKLEYAGDRVKTADDFIIHIASKSSMTGKLYYVKLKSGKKIPAEDWLRQHLDERKL